MFSISVRNHLFSMYAKLSKKPTFLTPERKNPFYAMILYLSQKFPVLDLFITPERFHNYYFFFLYSHWKFHG